MEVGRQVVINHPNKKDKIKCEFSYTWNNIPVFITNYGASIYSMIFKDASVLIAVSSRIIEIYDRNMLNTAFWHEVAHLYYKDGLTKWDVYHEYRADAVASLATSINDVVISLETAKVLYKSKAAIAVLDDRISKLISGGIIIDISPMEMIQRIKTVTVR